MKADAHGDKACTGGLIARAPAGPFYSQDNGSTLVCGY